MTTETQDAANAFLMGSGGRSAAFKEHGDEVDGIIVAADMRQQTDYKTGAPLVWENDNKPRMQLVVTLEVTGPALDEDDDLLRKVYVRGQMQKAVSDAVRQAGATGVANGGRLFVRYVGDAEPTARGLSGAKQYYAKYEAPTVTVSDGEPIDDREPPPDDVPW